MMGSAILPSGPPFQYLAPEQILGSREDDRSEIYALGIMLYQAVTGRLPVGELALGDLLKYIQEPLPPPQQFAPDLPPRLVQVIIKALEKDPAHRFQSVLEMGEALSKIG